MWSGGADEITHILPDDYPSCENENQDMNNDLFTYLLSISF